MALFESLSDRMNHIFSKLRNKGKLTELEIKQAMREIRVALLEADVNYNVVKDFTAKVSEKALGEDILKSLTPAQQIVKIVNDELCALMGSTHQKLAVSDKQPTIYMMCGLQGAGKTTMCGKLATYLKKQNKKVLLVAGDIYRPAAIQQLHVVAKKANTECFDMGQVDPVKIAKAGVEYALKNGYDTMIIDTAGRLHIDEALMQELINVKNAVKPTEILLVVDSMTGQDAVTVAQTSTTNSTHRRHHDKARRRYEGRRGTFHKSSDGQTYQVQRHGRKDGRSRTFPSGTHGVENTRHGRRAYAH